MPSEQAPAQLHGVALKSLLVLYVAGAWLVVVVRQQEPLEVICSRQLEFIQDEVHVCQ
jgi:hypothetical protein